MRSKFQTSFARISRISWYAMLCATVSNQPDRREGLNLLLPKACSWPYRERLQTVLLVVCILDVSREPALGLKEVGVFEVLGITVGG